MKLEEIKRELLKQKDPLKYLKELLKKIKDKDLEKKLKIIIEKLEEIKKEEKLITKTPPPNLEGLVRHAPRVAIESDIPKQFQQEIESTREISTDSIPSMALTVDKKSTEDYGIKAGKADYDITTEKVKKNLQESHFLTEHGFTSSAETKNLIDRKMGEYHLEEQKRYNTEDTPKYQKFEHVQEDNTGLTSLEREVKKQKHKFMPDYK